MIRKGFLYTSVTLLVVSAVVIGIVVATAGAVADELSRQH